MALDRLVPTKTTATGVRHRGAPLWRPCKILPHRRVLRPRRADLSRRGHLAGWHATARASALNKTRTAKSPPRRPYKILPYTGPVDGTAGAQTTALPGSTLLSSQHRLPKSPMSGLGIPC